MKMKIIFIVKCLPRQYILPYRDVTLFLSAVKVLDSALRLIRKAVRNQRKRGTQCERDSYNFNFNIVHLPHQSNHHFFQSVTLSLAICSNFNIECKSSVILQAQIVTNRIKMVRIVMNCLGKQNRRYLSRLSSNQIKSYRLSTIATPIATTEPSTIRITFLRHGQSTWNQQNIFIGKIFILKREEQKNGQNDRHQNTPYNNNYKNNLFTQASCCYHRLWCIKQLE